MGPVVPQLELGNFDGVIPSGAVFQAERGDLARPQGCFRGRFLGPLVKTRAVGMTQRQNPDSNRGITHGPGANSLPFSREGE
jgi:hypothetical protein